MIPNRTSFYFRAAVVTAPIPLGITQRQERQPCPRQDSHSVAIAGIATALELTLTGREVSAAEAYRLGLVSQVVPAADLLPTAEAYARLILNNSQPAIRSAKETILELIGRSLDDALRLEALNGYSSRGDFQEVRERLARFFSPRDDSQGS